MSAQVHQVVNARTGRVIATAVEEATGPWRSFRGLMLRKGLPDGHGMLFRPAKGIHTQFMRFPIDLIYLDKQNQVVKVRPSMRPWRFDFTNAAAVIEMTGGTADAVDVRAGDQLEFQPSPSS
ncbi:MAG: uncharacterized protein QOF73_5564 [Thermomicrobiales bacterium]|jgi:uncharacterized membrane protein (UPF0127 family)|nr:uncharacterized protein [Thermomicrobiales bacterium]